VPGSFQIRREVLVTTVLTLGANHGMLRSGHPAKNEKGYIGKSTKFMRQLVAVSGDPSDPGGHDPADRYSGGLRLLNNNQCYGVVTSTNTVLRD
jgi:hypothetical protein